MFQCKAAHTQAALEGAKNMFDEVQFVFKKHTNILINQLWKALKHPKDKIACCNIYIKLHRQELYRVK